MKLGELDDDGWDALVEQIHDPDRSCTPILGPELGFGSFETRADMAQTWAEELAFPFEAKHDLARVALFAAVNTDLAMAKKRFLNHLRKVQRRYDPANPDDPYGILASLPFPVYLTTNHDDFMFEALRKNPARIPRRNYIRWKLALESLPWDGEKEIEPSVALPQVFHVYGCDQKSDSLVLTEDEYLDFLGRIATPDKQLMPSYIDGVRGNALLFLGFRLHDLDFRVLLRFLNSQKPHFREHTHWCIQLSNESDDRCVKNRIEDAKEHLRRYHANLFVKVHVGPCQEFLKELRQRYKERSETLAK